MDLQGSKISRVWYRSEISRICPYITRITLEFRAFARHGQIRFWAGSEAQSQTQGSGSYTVVTRDDQTPASRGQLCIRVSEINLGAGTRASETAACADNFAHFAHLVRLKNFAMISSFRAFAPTGRTISLTPLPCSYRSVAVCSRQRRVASRGGVRARHALTRATAYRKKPRLRAFGIERSKKSRFKRALSRL